LRTPRACPPCTTSSSPASATSYGAWWSSVRALDAADVEAPGVDSSGTTRKLFDPAMCGTHDARAEGRRPSGQARGNGSRARVGTPSGAQAARSSTTRRRARARARCPSARASTTSRARPTRARLGHRRRGL
jgi:hypothetical protein